MIPVCDFYLSLVNCVLFPCLSPCLGEVGAYERYSVPLEYAANPQAVENKSSIEGAEVEGAMHHGLRNVKNAIVHRPCLGRGKHFTTEQETPGFALELHTLSHFPFLCNFVNSFPLPALVGGKGAKSMEVR